MDVAEAFDTVFLSTPSARRATLTLRKQIDEDKISIHALREEGDLQLQQCPLELELISIHALREEGDHGSRGSHSALLRISIHALREEGDQRRELLRHMEILFLSTPSARRATRTGSL